MFRTLTMVALIIGGLILAFAIARTSIAEAPAPEVPIMPPTVQELVSKYALQYNVSASRMLATMKCESGLNNLAVGDHGNSYGIAQIFLKAHPEVTKEQAQDPAFASEFMAKEFSKGNARIWTCWRKLYAQVK